MRITVRLFGNEAAAAGCDHVAVEVSEGQITCADVRAAMRDAYQSLQMLIDAARFAVNHEYAPDDYPITSGDEIALIGRVSGG